MRIVLWRPGGSVGCLRRGRDATSDGGVRVRRIVAPGDPMRSALRLNRMVALVDARVSPVWGTGLDTQGDIGGDADICVTRGHGFGSAASVHPGWYYLASR